jgi:aminotransferase
MIPGRAFGPGGEGFVRISYAAAPEKLREAARRVKAALAD